MKRWKTAAIIVAAVLLLAGCKTAANGNEGRGPGGAPDGFAGGGAFGVVTAIGENTITVAQMPEDMRPQGEGERPEGTGERARPEGTGERSTPGARPTGEGRRGEGTAPAGEGPRATMDTSGWETKTWTVDGDTKITSGDGEMQLADLRAGDSVRVTAKSGNDTVAGEITVMTGGTGGFPGGNPPDQNANNNQN